MTKVEMISTLLGSVLYIVTLIFVWEGMSEYIIEYSKFVHMLATLSLISSLLAMAITSTMKPRSRLAVALISSFLSSSTILFLSLSGNIPL